MIKAIIFDLDNCLAASDEPGRRLLAPTFDAIRRANHGTLSEHTLERAFDECWGHSLDTVARKYGFSAEMLAAGWAENARAEVQVPMHGYPDLGVIRGLPATLFLWAFARCRYSDQELRAPGMRRATSRRWRSSRI
jgi:phosphoglycolate phosphatase-like HAD superfamily hydrolase